MQGAALQVKERMEQVCKGETHANVRPLLLFPEVCSAAQPVKRLDVLQRAAGGADSEAGLQFSSGSCK